MVAHMPAVGISLVCLSLFSFLAKSLAAQEGASYELRPNDLLDVQFADWPGAGDWSATWTALSRDYVVGPDGTVSVPLAGRLTAAGSSVAEFQAELEAALKENLGLKTAPGLAVFVKAYAPVYVVGDIEMPGVYSLPPGTMAIGAIAIAGGYRTAASAFSLQRELAYHTAERRADEAAIISLTAREARLARQYAGADKMVLSEFKGNAGDKVSEALQREVEAFELQKDQSIEQLQGFADLIELLEAEITSIQQKVKAQKERLAAVADVSKDINDLSSRGLVSSDRVLASQSALASLEGSLIDLEQSRFEAKVRISELERERRLKISNAREEALSELIEVRAQLVQLRSQVSGSRTAEAIISLELGQLPEGITEHSITVMRRVGGNVVEIPADEMTSLQPADVLLVSTKARN